MNTTCLRGGSLLTFALLILVLSSSLLAQGGLSGEAVWTFDPTWRVGHIAVDDLTGDGVPDILAAENNPDYYGEIHKVYGINGENGDTLWEYSVDDAVRSFAVGDIDGDSILDVVAGASYNSATTPDGRVHAISGADGSQIWVFNVGATVSAVTVGDLNNDNQLDVAAGSFDDFIYAIDGATGLLLWSKDIGSLWINDLAAVDVDADGDDDVAYAHEYLAGFDQYCGVLNGSDGSKIWEETVSYINLTVHAANIDSDSIPEVIFGTVFGDDHAEIMVRTGNTGEIEWSFNLGSLDHTNGEINLHTFDVDEDNDLDLLVGNNLGVRVIYAFDGTNNTPMWASDTLDGFPVDIAVGDVTDDKELNIVAATFDRVSVLNSDGSILEWYYSVAGTFAGVEVADFDGDDVLDIAACGSAEGTFSPPNPGKGVWVLRTAASPLLWEHDFGQYGNAIAIGDLNDDGYDEVAAVCSVDDKVWVIDGQSGLLLWSWTGTANLYAVTMGDFDGDADLDVAVAGDDDRVTALYGSDGSFMWEYPNPGDQIYRKCLQSADLNADGAWEVIAGSDDSFVYAIDGPSGLTLWSMNVGGAVGEVEIAQMNAIGAPDVVVAVGGSTAGQRVAVLDGSTGSELWDFDAPQAVEHVEVFHANLDSVPDVALAVTPINPRQIIAVDGVSHTQLWSAPVEAASNTHSMSHGDLNGDGIDEVIVPGNSTNKNVYALNGVDGSELWHYSTGGEVNSVLAFDVDNDFEMEVIAGSDDQNIYVLEPLTGDTSWVYSCADDVMHVGVGDISNDGLPNIACVTFGSNGLVYAFNTLASGPLYTCGDADGNESVSIADAVYIIQFIFGGGPAPDPPEAADCDCSGTVSIGDAVYLINFIFGGGPAPCAGCL